MPEDLREQIQAIVDSTRTGTTRAPRSRLRSRCSGSSSAVTAGTPEGIVQAARVMQVTPAYLESVALPLRPSEDQPQGAIRFSSAPTSPAGCGRR